jgi:DNA polymerase-3 subunit chi
VTRVDFYILPETARRTSDQVLCSLTGKAWKQGKRVYIHTESSDRSSKVDTLLWTFKDVSFLPHGLIDRMDAEKTPVLIGHEDPPADQHDIMINMTNTVPLFFGRFDRLIEIVDHASEGKNLARERYRFYKDRGYTLNTHNLDS